MPLRDGCQLIIKLCSEEDWRKKSAPNATLNSSPTDIRGVRGNFHISPLFRMKLMWQKWRLIAQQLDGLGLGFGGVQE